MEKHNWSIKRRHFLMGSSLGALSLGMPGLALPSGFGRQALSEAVVGEMACWVRTPLADFYRPTRSNRATVDYVGGLDQEELLRRHPFC